MAYRQTTAKLPLWLPLITTLVLPVWWLRRYLRQRRLAQVQGFPVEQATEPKSV